MNFARFQSLPVIVALPALLNCCHSRVWAESLLAMRPFASLEEFWEKGERLWLSLSEQDWLEAFEAHPKIGDVESLRRKYESTKAIAAGEQAGAVGADNKILEELAEFNEKYYEKFGFIFIIFATGKTAKEMLDFLKVRVQNSRAQELQNAALEQWKITRLRLEKL